jgi:CRP-like cAMP-binding protein
MDREPARKSSPLIGALSVNALFSGLGADAIQQVAELCTTVNLSDGQSLFVKGDPGDALFGIRRGQIVVTTTTRGGRQLTLNILGPGDILGEIALLDGRPRSADATASGPAELFMIRRADFQNLLRRRSEIAMRLIEILCDRLRWSSDRVEEASLLAFPVRLARRLLKLADDFGDEIIITQEELSILTGAGRETVNRQLQKWQQGGIVTLGRGRVQVVKMGRLREEAVEPE